MTLILDLAPSVPWAAPVPLRVSSTRVGPLSWTKPVPPTVTAAVVL
ncbi:MULTISPECIES: hypothetical protein [unclassified Streptomyces]